MTIRKRLIGYGVTDGNGVAQSTYTGKGYGEIDVQAESVGEHLFDDKGTSGTPNSEWWKSSSSSTITSTSNGLTFQNNASATAYLSPNKNGTSKSSMTDLVDWEQPFAVEFDIVSVDDNTTLELRNEDATARQKNLTGYGNSHIKLTYQNDTMTVYKDGVQVNSQSIDKKVMVRFGVPSSKQISFKNFVLYKPNNDLSSDEKQIMDYIAYDDGSTNIWNIMRCTKTKTDNGTVFKADGTGTSSINLISNSSFIIPVDIDWVMEFDLKTDNQIGIYFTYGATTSTAFTVGYYNTNLNSHKLVYDSSNYQIKHYVNGSSSAYETKDLLDKTAPLRWSITDWQTDMSLTLNNFKVYPI